MRAIGGRRRTLRVYRALLLAYPAEFRYEYGAEMVRLAAERMETESRLGVWLALAADVAVHAPREHLQILDRDVRHSLRLMAKAPGFALTALLALALGVGAAVTIFSLVNAVLLRTLPFGEVDRLAYLWTPLPRYESLPREMSPSYADVVAWRSMSHSFQDITALRQRMFTLTGTGGPTQIGGALVEGNFFRTLEASPLVGRTFDASDDRPGQERVAVIGYSLWRSQWNLDPAVLGRSVQIGKQTYRIVGVMPAGFTYPHSLDFPFAMANLARAEIWIPIALTAKQQADRMLSSDAAIGRLRPGISLRQAQSEMSAIQSGLDPLNVPEMRGSQSYITPFLDTVVGPVRPLMRLLAGAVLLVLLIACGNVASLLMARAVGRLHEMGVRTALGAPRARLVRQLLTESLMLSTIGGGFGALLSVAALRVLTRLNPGDIPRFDETSMDGRVLLFAVLVSIGTGLVFGIPPALTSSRIQVSELLRQGGGRGIAAGSPRARNGLIVAEVALSVVLLAGAGLLLRSYLAVQGEDKGFDAGTLTMRLASGQSRTPLQTRALVEAVVGRVAGLPGVIAVGATSALPLSHSESISTFRVEGYPNRPNQTANMRGAAGDFFRAMQIRLIAGRYLTPSDQPAEGQEQPAAVLVSESFARQYFPRGNAVGGHLQRGDPGNSWSTIVGVVADVRHTSLEKPPEPTLYDPSWHSESLAIRTALPPEAMIASVRRVVREVDPGTALADVRTMRERTSEAAGRRTFQTVLLTVFAAIAVFLVLVGLYGLLSYAVRQRTAEIGVRIALGASRRAVIGMVVRHGLMLTAGGLAVGLLAAAAMARWASSLLYGVRALDPVTFVAVPAFMMAAAASACFLPAWKAARIDPVRALRQQ